MNELYKRVLKRFLRAFLAGAFATMATIVPLQANNWGDIKVWIGALVISAFIGGISGVVMAGDKYFRAK